MSPFCASTGGGSHVTSSWVAVADWIITFWGGAVGTVGGQHTNDPYIKRQGHCYVFVLVSGTTTHCEDREHYSWKQKAPDVRKDKLHPKTSFYRRPLLHTGCEERLLYETALIETTGSVHTCLSHKHLLWRAGWPLAHSIVYTHAYLVALVFTQLCGRRTRDIKLGITLYIPPDCIDELHFLKTLIPFCSQFGTPHSTHVDQHYSLYINVNVTAHFYLYSLGNM